MYWSSIDGDGRIMMKNRERERESNVTDRALDGNVFIHRFAKQRGSNRCVVNKAGARSAIFRATDCER